MVWNVCAAQLGTWRGFSVVSITYSRIPFRQRIIRSIVYRDEVGIDDAARSGAAGGFSAGARGACRDGVSPCRERQEIIVQIRMQLLLQYEYSSDGAGAGADSGRNRNVGRRAE